MHQNAVLVSPFLTQMVSGNFRQQTHFVFFKFCRFDDETKNTIDSGHVSQFSFCFFSSFLFVPTKTTRNPKFKFLFENHSLTSRKCLENTVCAPMDTVCDFKHTPRHYKNMEKSRTNFNTSLGPIFNTKTPKSWTNF